MKQYKTTEKQRLAVTEHYWKNREAKLDYARKYRKENAEKLQSYREAHRDEMKVYNDAYLDANRETLKAKSTRYFDEHPGYRAMSFKRWASANKDKIRVRKRKYDKEKRQTDPAYRLQCNLRSRIQQALKSTKRHSNRTMKWTGCTIEFLKGWLESRFQPGMSWDNYNRHGWHVDHIIPCDFFDLTNLEEAHQCFHYSNLQPLWADDNLRKSNFVGDGTEPKKNYEDRGQDSDTEVEPTQCCN